MKQGSSGRADTRARGSHHCPHARTHTRAPGPQDLHVELADDIQTGFPPSRHRDPQNPDQGITRKDTHTKAELEGDPGTATPRPTQASRADASQISPTVRTTWF